VIDYSIQARPKDSIKMTGQKLIVLLISFWSLLLQHEVVGAFQPSAFASKTRYSSILLAKKGAKGGAAAKGFGKVPEPVVDAPKAASDDEPTRNSGRGLQSVGGPSVMPTYNPYPDIELDPNLSPEERTKQLLAQKYGLRTLEEQQREAKLLEKKQEMMKKQAAWKKAAEADEIDLFSTLPAPLLVGIDRFLKIGLAVTTVAFIVAGLGITAEAWQASSGNALPEEVDQFIVNVVEPNFTTGLLVLLGFSISLGIFATAQLGSASSVYNEGKK
jgi:hypothetical protein